MSDTMPPIQCTCPHCGQQLAIPAQFAGQQGKCRFCNKAFIAPLPELPIDKPKVSRKSMFIGVAILLLCLAGGWGMLRGGVDEAVSPSVTSEYQQPSSQNMDNTIKESPALPSVNRNAPTGRTAAAQRQQPAPTRTASERRGNSAGSITLSDFGTNKFTSTSLIEQANRYRGMSVEELYDLLAIDMTFAETLRILGNPQVLDSRFISFSGVKTRFEWWVAPRHKLLVDFANDKITEVEIMELNEKQFALEQFLYEYRRAHPTAPRHEGLWAANDQGLYEAMFGFALPEEEEENSITIICPEENGITTRTNVRIMYGYQTTEGYEFEVHAKAYPHKVFSHWNVSRSGKKTENPLLIKTLPRNITIEAVFKEHSSENIEDRIQALADTSQRVQQIRQNMSLEEVERIMGRLESYVDGFTKLDEKFGSESPFKKYAYYITDDIRLKFTFIRGELSWIENQHVFEHPADDIVILDQQKVL